MVILDNLNVHKSPQAAEALAERGAWLFVSLRGLRPRSSSLLPKYSPDLNPCMDGSCAARAFVSFFELVGCGHVFGVFVQRVCRAP